MELNIDIEIFKSTFGIKPTEDKPGYYTLLGHKPGTKMKLFPFDAHPGSSEVVKDLSNVIGGFIRQVQKEGVPSLTYDKYLCDIKEHINFSSTKDEEEFENMVREIFFDFDKRFKPTNIGTYKLILCNTKEEKIAEYLYNTLCIGYEVNTIVARAIKNGNYNVLENLLMTLIIPSSPSTIKENNPYKAVVSHIQEVFCNDLRYMLDNVNFTKEYLINLLEHYYFFYTSQACMLLNRFFDADRSTPIPLYYCIDWEKTSKNRPCYYDGWQKLQKHLTTLFSHAVTLEILNQNDDKDKLDYIDIRNIINEYPEKDEEYALRIIEVANLYRACFHADSSAEKVAEVRLENIEAETKTERAVKFLYNSVLTQFEHSSRNRANDAYTEKFELFCKTKFLKNRRAMGLMLNLTEQDVLFLTKLSLKGKNRMRLNDVFVEFEKRGVYVDTPSKFVVMNYFEKLNLIEKKSDSGDAQYVKGIL